MANYEIYSVRFTKDTYVREKKVFEDDNLSKAIGFLKSLKPSEQLNAGLYNSAGRLLANKYRFEYKGKIKYSYKILDFRSLGQQNIDVLKGIDRRPFQDRFPNSKTFQDFKNEISIIELATSVGYKSNTQWAKGKSTRLYPCLENDRGDKIVLINPNSTGKQFYFNPISGNEYDKGDLIKFVQNRLATDFKRANIGHDKPEAAINSVLYEYLKIDENTRKSYQSEYKNDLSVDIQELGEDRKFVKELFKFEKLSDFKYLESQGISKETVMSEVFKDRVFQIYTPSFDGQGNFAGHNTNFKNIGFGYYENLKGEIAGVELRNFNFKGHAVTSQKIKSVGFSNAPDEAKNIVFCEGFKDALSHYELNKPGKPFYFITGGRLTEQQTKTIKNIIGEMKISNGANYRLAFDNDVDGRKYDLKVLTSIFPGAAPLEKSHTRKNQIDLEFKIPEKPNFVFKIMENVEPYNVMVKEVISNEFGSGGEAHKSYKQFIDKLSTGQKSVLKKEDWKGIAKTDDDAEKFAGLAFKYDSSLITFEVKGDKALIKVPNEPKAIEVFNEAYIKVNDLTERVLIEKSVLNDFNDDLKVLKGLGNTNDGVKKKIVEKYNSTTLKKNLNSGKGRIAGWEGIKTARNSVKSKNGVTIKGEQKRAQKRLKL